jgi:hypothetical protein
MVHEDKEKSDEAEPIQFKSIQFPYNLTPGSQSSINFHKALLESSSSSLETFRSQTVQAILSYKWDLIKFRAQTNALAYMLYIFALWARVVYRDVWSVLILLGFAIYFTGFELLQAYINKLEYFTSFWNVFDFIRLILLATCLLTWIRENERALMSHEFQLYLLATVILFSWFRALSYLRMFQTTRVLIKLIVEVAKDMISFIVVLIIAVIGFSITFLVLNEDQDMVSSLKYNYRVMYGDFDTDSYPQGGNWVLFIIASTILPLVMLNMLIAIMSDTYARVMADIVPSDFAELNDMILEQEEVLLWRRGLGKPQFLHFGVVL